jgi:hypothetical protein
VLKWSWRLFRIGNLIATIAILVVDTVHVFLRLLGQLSQPVTRSF